MPIPQTLLEQLTHCLGEAQVLTGTAVTARAKHYWNAEPRVAAAILRPGTTDEVAQVLALCHKARQKVVMHGGLTGLVDGDRSDEDDVVLSLERMNQITEIDTVGKTMTVEAGCILQRVHERAEEENLSFGLDLGARGSCTIGGNIATNAGGLTVLRYGMMRDQVLGLEVVLMDGTVLTSMNALLKNNAGHDLKHLFVGSEGTLGVITRAVLRLRPSTRSVNTAFLACPRFKSVTSVLDHLQSHLNGQLNSFEILWKPVVQLNTDPNLPGTVSAPIELNEPYYIIAESKGSDLEQDGLIFERALDACFENEWATNGVLAQSQNEQQSIWAIRENIDLMLDNDPIYVFDVSLPIAAMESYVESIDNALQARWPNAKLYSYGHLADGNLHIIIAPPPNPEDNLEQQHQDINTLVYGPLTELGGSVSAEHGIGFSKKPWLRYSRTEQEIQTMQLLKQSFDPHNLLNTGRIVDPC